MHASSSEKDSGQEGYPMREWQIQIFLMNSAGEEIAANVFGQATYNLHPSFPKPVHSKYSSSLSHVHKSTAESTG